MFRALCVRNEFLNEGTFALLPGLNVNHATPLTI